MKTNKGDILADRIEKIMASKEAYIDDGVFSTPQSEIRAALADYRAPWTLGRSVNGFTLGDGQQWHREDWTEDMLPDGWRPRVKGEGKPQDFLCCHNSAYAEWGPWHVSGNFQNEDEFFFRTTRPLPAAIKPILTPEQIAAGWVEWHGGECPVGGGSLVNVQFRWGGTGEISESGFDWTHNDSGEDIIAYLPEPVMVPLEPDDVPPGSSLLPPNTEPRFWRAVVEIASDCVQTKSGFVYFSDMKKEHWLIHRPGTFTADGKPLWVRCEKVSI